MQNSIKSLADQMSRDALAIEGTLTKSLVDQASHSVLDVGRDVLNSIRIMPTGLSERIERFIAAIRAHRPPNWPDDDDDLDPGSFSTFVKDTRWPIVWVPRAAVVRVLLDADPADRDAVLIAHQADLVADCHEALDECSDGVVGELIEYARAALRAAEADNLPAAQALAAAVVTTVLEVHLRFPSLNQAAKGLVIDTDEVAFDRARIGYILSCIPRSLSNFGDRNGEPEPEYFNRHATLHHVCGVQYKHQNALVALMLVTALLREIDELDRSGRWAGLFEDVEDDPPNATAPPKAKSPKKRK